MNCMAELDLIKEMAFAQNPEGGKTARCTGVWEKSGEGKTSAKSLKWGHASHGEERRPGWMIECARRREGGDEVTARLCKVLPVTVSSLAFVVSNVSTRAV